jgi:hypothetical protein
MPLSVSEFSKLSGLHPDTVRELCRVGKLKAKRLTKKAQGRWAIYEDPSKF